MIKSNVSRAKRREFVKFYRDQLVRGGHYICFAADCFKDYAVKKDVHDCVQHSIEGAGCTTIPTAFGAVQEPQRQQVRNKWLRVYAEQGVAYHWGDTDQPYTK